MGAFLEVLVEAAEEVAVEMVLLAVVVVESMLLKEQIYIRLGTFELFPIIANLIMEICGLFLGLLGIYDGWVDGILL